MRRFFGRERERVGLAADQRSPGVVLTVKSVQIWNSRRVPVEPALSVAPAKRLVGLAGVRCRPDPGRVGDTWADSWQAG